MAEFVNTSIVEVAAGQNVPLTETAVKGNACVCHREGAGNVSLRGNTNQCRALYRCSFGANIAIPDGGTVEAITIALAVDGEALTSATATVTPAATEDYFNIYVSVLVAVPRGCCVTVAAQNTSTQAINVANANLIIDRVA